MVEVPLHLSIGWVPVYHPDPERAGSLGAGILLEPGVVVEVHAGRGLMAPRTPSLTRSLEMLGWRGEPAIRLVTPVKLGVGLGASGALALAATLGYATWSGISTTRAARVQWPPGPPGSCCG